MCVCVCVCVCMKKMSRLAEISLGTERILKVYTLS